MKHPLALALATALATLALGACQAPVKPDQPATTAVTAPKAAPNPLFTASPLPLQFPQFDQIQDVHFGPAFDRGMAEQLGEIDAIVNNPAAPSFDNTILAMERSGQVLQRTATVFFSLVGADTNDARKAIQADYSPKLAAHRDAIYLNPKLFERVSSLYRQRNQLGLDAEGVRLIERYHDDFVRAGAELGAAQQERLKVINGELAKLATRFSQNVLAEVNDSAIVVDSKEELDGLPANAIAAAAEAAKARKLDGKYVLALQNTTGQPAETYLNNRALRQRIHEASVTRNSRGNANDNTAIVAQIMKLRLERAQMLGYPDYASYSLANQTAKTTAAVNKMLGELAPAAVANARREAADLQRMIDREQKAKGQKSFKLEPWDWAYYAEKVRKAKYAFDEAQLKPYLEAKNVLENGVFHAAGQLYGLKFKQRTDLPLYQPDLLVYDVYNEDGTQLAIFIEDMYARPSKRGGAWMNAYVQQNRLFGTKPVVANHLNVPKPPAGEPTLLTWDETRTMFHEFGHALHGMFSDVSYPYFAGTSVPRDFVEFPSQVNEMWADWPSVLANYARHYQTGEAMPTELLDKVTAAAQFNEGFRTTEYLGAAMLDQNWHQIRQADAVPAADAVMSFETDALKRDGIYYPPVPPRYRTPYFSHIMGGYAAGYYSYIWSEVLDADTVQWIKQHGGLTRANGDRFRATLLSRGGSKDALDLFRDFTGGEPDIKPLLERRGLAGHATKAAPGKRKP
ncbi:MAG: M3 family metallopeptidase [Dokdonella sp.]|nr:MAG: M3 family metallopeptidase [Dokdonella sp.]